MQAVILAGGKGTRLRPYTVPLPKPLVPVGEHPILEVLLRQLRHHGFGDVVISTGHLAELIEAYCRGGRRWGLKIRYVREETPLSTAGALKLVRGLAPHFLTLNGDVLTTLDPRALLEFHRRQRAMATVSVCARRHTVDFGVLDLTRDGRVRGYAEKPSFTHFVSMGINALDRRALRFIRPGEALGMPDLILRLVRAGQRVLAYRSRAQWLDIGRPDDYQAAQDLFASPARRARYLP